MRRVIVSVTNDLTTDNRVKRTCSLIHELGHEVLLVGRSRKNSLLPSEFPWKTKRFRLLFNKGPLFYAEYNMRLFFYLLVKKVDVLYANDLDTLPANFLAFKLKSKTKLIYDTHELFTEVPELIHRKFAKNTWIKIESYIFPKLDHIVTVNESIAKIYETKYDKPLLVVRNVPAKWNKEDILSRTQLGLPPDKFIIIMQGSGLNVARGLEEAVQAMQYIENALLVVVGNGDVIPQAKEMVCQKKLEDRVKFFEKRPYSEMMQFTSNANLGLTLDKPLSDNYKFSLPNKLFDYIQAGIPILSSDLVELRKIIDKYQIGCIVDTVSATEIAQKINFLIENPNTLDEYKSNCHMAAECEIWEHEKLKLKSLLDKILVLS